MRRHEEIYASLEPQIRTLPAGSKLPSFRTLMKRFGSSQASVELALRALEAEGLIVRRRRSGIYVSPAAVRARTIEFLTPDVSTRSWSLLVRGGEEAAREMGYGLQVRSYGERLPATGDEVERVAGVVIVLRSPEVDSGAAARLLETLPRGVPAVTVDQPATDPRWPFVGLQDYEAGVMGGEVFRRRGIRRLACVGSSVSRVAQARLSGLVAGFGQPPQMLVDFSSPERFDREALRRFASSGIEGLFILRPDLALQTLCFLESLRIRVPEDLFVVTIAEEDDERAYPYRVVAIVKPTLEEGREAVKALFCREPVSRRLPYRLSETGAGVFEASGLRI